jgi:hypothetical protein
MPILLPMYGSSMLVSDNSSISFTSTYVFSYARYIFFCRQKRTTVRFCCLNVYLYVYLRGSSFILGIILFFTIQLIEIKEMK